MRFTKLLTGTILSGAFLVSVVDTEAYLWSGTTKDYVEKHIRSLRKDKSSPDWVKNAELAQLDTTTSKNLSAVSSFDAIGRIIAEVFSGRERTSALGINYYANKINESYKNDTSVIDKKGAFTQPYLHAVVLTEIIKAYMKNNSQKFENLYKTATDVIKNEKKNYSDFTQKLFGNLDSLDKDMRKDLSSYWNGLKLTDAIDGLKKFEQEVNDNADLLKLKSLS